MSSAKNQRKLSCNIRRLLQDCIDKSNPCRKLTAEETKRLKKLDAIAAKLKRGENLQNRQLQTWLCEDKYSQVDAEWKE